MRDWNTIFPRAKDKNVSAPIDKSVQGKFAVFVQNPALKAVSRQSRTSRNITRLAVPHLG
jgi:hypothetical protein